MAHRNTVETTPHHVPGLTFYHPAMQEALLEAAANAGAEVEGARALRKCVLARRRAS